MREPPGRRLPASCCLILAATVVASSANCRSTAPESVDFSTRPRNFVPQDYGDIYERWTRHDHVWDGEGLVIETWATLKSWEFREAFVEKYAKAYALGEDDRAGLREAEREAAQGTVEFVVAAQTNDFRSNDIDDRDSAWRVYLTDESGARFEPDAIEVARFPSIYEDVFFSSHTAFSRTYVIRFDRAPSRGGAETSRETALSLWIAGPRGSARMVWSAKEEL